MLYNQIAFIAVIVGSAFAAPPQYTAEIIPPPGKDLFASPRDITADAQTIVGHAAPYRDFTPYQGVTATPGAPAVPLIAERDSFTAVSISPDGSVIGGSSNSEPVVWDNGTFKHMDYRIETKHILLWGPHGDVQAINSSGLCVASLNTDFPYEQQAVYWTGPDAAPLPLPSLPTVATLDLSPGGAYDVNDAGQITGTARTTDLGFEREAVRWDSPTSNPTVIPPAAGATYMDGRAINQQGDVAGFASYPDLSAVEGFFWDSDTNTTVATGILPGHFNHFAKALDVNDAQQVVGFSDAGLNGFGSSTQHATLWQDGVLYDLNDLTPPIPGVVYLAGAYAITDDGSIVCEAITNENPCCIEGVIVLLTPVEGCLADLNGDGVLDFFDVGEFLTLFGAANPAVDFNGDGVLDFFDVSIFLEAFNTACQPD